MSNSAAAALELRDVHRTYKDGSSSIAALSGVTVAFFPGSFTAVMGPSGSGKSTLLHCAGGLEAPSSGEVILAGRDISSASDDELTALRRGAIGCVVQNFNRVASLTAERNVALPLKLAGKPPSRSEVHSVLADVGLSDRRQHRPREMSGGQQQRVALARALVMRPTVLLADEPTGALDTKAAGTVLGLLRGMVDDRQMTVVMVTHDPVAAAAADRVVFLSDGRIVDAIDQPTPETVAERLAGLDSPN